MYSSSDIYRSLTANQLDIIPPPHPDDIQPASIDLHLHREILVSKRTAMVDPFDEETYPVWVPADRYDEDGSVRVSPGELVLASTVERLVLPRNLVAVVEGKSSLARLGLLVHQTAGFVDPGFDGQITLELSVAGSWPVLVRPGMAICQVSFARTETPASYGYDGKYQGQDGPVPSLYHKNAIVSVFS